jgi:hypothetical protein
MALLVVAGVVGDEFTLDWWTVDGGGEMWCTGGDFESSGTIGQPDANTGVMVGGGYELSGGFWAGVAAGAPLPGDSDGDGDVDLDDFTEFEGCLAGPDGGSGSSCDFFDFDTSGDVDLYDFAEFQEAFTG